MSSTYCTESDIDQVFGSSNVDQWADLENTGVAATKTARINWAIANAGDDIDSVLGTHHYRIPIQDESASTPTMIRDLAAILAGVRLYESRGVEDTAPRGRHRLSSIRNYAYRTLEQIRRGDREIPGAV